MPPFKNKDTTLTLLSENRGSFHLVIDLDDQANSSLYLGVNKATEFDKAKSIDEFNKILNSFRTRKEVIDLLRDDIDSPEFNYQGYVDKNSLFNKYIEKNGSTGRIDVLPGSYRTKEDDSLTQIAGGGGIRQNRLFRALHRTAISNDYNYVIIDTPPNLTMVGMNGLYAAHYLLIPTQLEYFSVFGVNSVIANVRKTVQFDTEGKRGRVLGVVPMMTEPKGKNRINKFASELLQQTLPPDVEIFPEIKRTSYFSDAAREKLPFSVFAEKKSSVAGPAAMQLFKLTDRLIARIDQEENAKGS